MAFTNRFTTRAGTYATSRPSYPAAAVDAIFAGLGDPKALAVADLGAGTGISSRLIADRGPRVFAIEPNASMREAAQSDARIAWIDGTAERTTLGDASVDVVTAFQAWHWVEGAAGVAEVRRIVRPGGNLSIVYNERDERDPFTNGFGDIVRRYAIDATERRRAGALAHALAIDPVRTTRSDFRNSQTLDRRGVHARAESSSYLPQAGAAADAMHADLDALLDRFAIASDVDIHLVTIVARIDVSHG